MNPVFENIPRLGQSKIKPKIGEIRLTIDGTRRKIFDGNCWQYLCIGDPNCRVQAKATCRYHRTCLPDEIEEKSSSTKSSPTKSSQLQTGETQKLPNGTRRIWRGARWHSLCRADNCPVQAKDFCKTHQNQRNSLPITNLNSSPKSQTKKRACSLVPTTETDAAVEVSQEESISFSEQPSLKDNAMQSVAISPTEKRELHTRNGRRVRCNGLIWKHLCAEKKSNLLKRKYQRRKVPIEKIDPITELNPPTSDTSEITIKPATRASQKRPLTSDINHEEHIVPKRRNHNKTRKTLDKSISISLEAISSNISVSDIPVQENSIEEPLLTDSDLSLSSKPNRLQRHDQSIEIPVQFSSSSSSFSYDSSTSAIVEQFGTIIKKEAIVEEETIICFPSTVPNQCETLQDFLRAEDMKTKEFQLDCQRISYRLAKIQDCIGSILN